MADLWPMMNSLPDPVLTSHGGPLPMFEDGPLLVCDECLGGNHVECWGFTDTPEYGVHACGCNEE